MNIKTSSYLAEGMTKDNMQEQLFGNFCHQEIFPPKRVRQNMQGCVSCSMQSETKNFDPSCVHNC